MIALITRIFLAVLALVSIGVALHTGGDGEGDWLAKSERLLRKGDVKQARAVVDAAIDGDFVAYNAVATAFYLDYTQARNRKVIPLLLEQARVWTGQEKLYSKEWQLFHTGNALLYQELGQLDKAEVELKKALDADPDNPDLLNALGWFYADNDIKPDQALKLTKKAAELSPDNAAIVDSLGWAYYKLGEYDRAITTLRRAVELMPDEPELRYHLGAAYFKRGRSLQARIELNKALLLKPSMSEPRTLLRKNGRR